MKKIVLLTTLLFVLASFGVTNGAVLFHDDFEDGLAEAWISYNVQGEGKWEVVTEDGNGILKQKEKSTWVGATFDGVASLEEHEEIWASCRTRIDDRVDDPQALGFGLLAKPSPPTWGNWYVHLTVKVGMPTLHVIEAVTGPDHDQSAFPYTLEDGKWYKMKIAVLKKTLYGKMWPEEEEEPKKWIVQATMDNHLEEDGVSIMTWHLAVSFDDLIVADSEDGVTLRPVSPKEKLATCWAILKAEY